MGLQFNNSQDSAIASEKNETKQTNKKCPHWLEPKGEFLGLCNRKAKGWLLALGMAGSEIWFSDICLSCSNFPLFSACLHACKPKGVETGSQQSLGLMLPVTTQS